MPTELDEFEGDDWVKEEIMNEVDLTERLRNALATLDFVRSYLTQEQTEAVRAIDICLQKNKALFCESMKPKEKLDE